MQLGVLGCTDTLCSWEYWDVPTPCAVGCTGMYTDTLCSLVYWDVLIPCAVRCTGMYWYLVQLGVQGCTDTLCS